MGKAKKTLRLPKPPESRAHWLERIELAYRQRIEQTLSAAKGIALIQGWKEIEKMRREMAPPEKHEVTVEFKPLGDGPDDDEEEESPA